MRSKTTLLTLLLLVGCAKRAPEASGPQHPELVCGEGATPYGAVPPEGSEAWCHKPDPKNGEWLKHGTYIRWHENQQKAAQGQYVHGKKDGPWTYWYPTGDIEKQGSYAGGVEEGFWTAFHADGKRASEGKMIDGKEHGPWVYWSEGHTTRTEGAWNLGNQDGVWTIYDSKDKAIAEQVYRAGRLISKREL